MQEKEWRMVKERWLGPVREVVEEINGQVLQRGLVQGKEPGGAGLGGGKGTTDQEVT